jgi:hypothetical protein
MTDNPLLEVPTRTGMALGRVLLYWLARHHQGLPTTIRPSRRRTAARLDAGAGRGDVFVDKRQSSESQPRDKIAWDS